MDDFVEDLLYLEEIIYGHQRNIYRTRKTHWNYLMMTNNSSIDIVSTKHFFALLLQK